jgi:hypothetical protein
MRNTVGVILACLTAVGITALLSHTYRHRNRANDVISVTGLAERDFTADLIVWNARFTARRLELKDAFQQLKRDRKLVREFLEAKAIPAAEIVFSSISIDKEHKTRYLKDGGHESEFIGFRLTQGVEISSKDVRKVEVLAREVTELINSGLEIYSNAPEYYYTKLGALKIEMLALATANAKTRAEKMAGNAGGILGKLKYAKLGVFQITAQNSSEKYTWMGAYNTSSKDKTGAITVKLQYELQ